MRHKVLQSPASCPGLFRLTHGLFVPFFSTSLFLRSDVEETPCGQNSCPVDCVLTDRCRRANLIGILIGGAIIPMKNCQYKGQHPKLPP